MRSELNDPKEVNGDNEKTLLLLLLFFVHMEDILYC